MPINHMSHSLRAKPRLNKINIYVKLLVVSSIAYLMSQERGIQNHTVKLRKQFLTILYLYINYQFTLWKQQVKLWTIKKANNSIPNQDVRRRKNKRMYQMMCADTGYW